jgi:hypothetical protein
VVPDTKIEDGEATVGWQSDRPVEGDRDTVEPIPASEPIATDPSLVEDVVPIEAFELRLNALCRRSR